MSITYPHRITFINRGKCSICCKVSNKIVNTTIDHYFGWESCGNSICNKVIKKSFDKTTITKEYLISKFGTFLKILRSNNKIDYDWEFDSDAMQEKEKGPFWVFVKNLKQNKRKEITLDSIKEIN
jgi:hypothetical protein|tara:strand:+ start:488 stop:862 length:375 start_codon:yes stop_codon:yes gene_type:complete